ncbi:pentatricopeptide repeat-containing protein [Corchorus olitorius]|uniref:Pentatricopeptide repeat-containing protein n=1 Tax=Corchorus olitorius TaxID=93759 RepID=A0A1R3GGJ9_9ROSI|nr:pentatricopeptide repeat-containing protein [Corchorus olitorius]
MPGITSTASPPCPAVPEIQSAAVDHQTLPGDSPCSPHPESSLFFAQNRH